MSKKILFLFSLLVFILFLIILIFAVNKFSNNKENNKIVSKDLNLLIAKIDKTVTKEDKNSAEYGSVIQYLEKAKTSSSKEEEFKNVESAIGRLQLLYTLTNHNYLYKFINDDLARTVKNIYPNLYEGDYFIYPCQDESCADSEQPKEILKIIDGIKNSDFPKEYKEIFTRSLLNNGYRSKEEASTKASVYYRTAKTIEISSDISESDANLKIAEEIKQFVKLTYPKDFEQLELINKTLGN